MIYEWNGTDPDGGSRYGTLRIVPEDLTGFVQARFDAGWRDLFVWGRDDEQMAQIITTPSGQREWWAPDGAGTEGAPR